MLEKPLISVIIPTYNSEKFIWKCLESIKNQIPFAQLNNVELKGDFIEIIVVDNNSKDKTKEIALKYTKNFFNKWPERTTQKNYWIEKAKWKYVCFIDSDMELSPQIISECVNLFSENENIWWICIPEKSFWKWLFVKIRDFERSFYGKTNIESARFFKLEDVKSVWGFEEDLIFFEESLLPQKIEAKLNKSCKLRIKSYILHNEWDISMWKWFAKKFYYGKSLDKYKKKVQEIGITEIGNNQMGIFHRYMIFLKSKRFYTKPCLALWVLALKTLEFGSGALWLFCNNIKWKKK